MRYATGEIPPIALTCGSMLALGIVALLLTVAVLATRFFLLRRFRFPVHGWLGLAFLALAEALLIARVGFVTTYFTAIAWTSYLFIVDAAIFAVRGRSPLKENARGVARVALLSIPLWLIFEAYNLRLANWVYVGLPESLPARWFGYAWAFATITPAILLTAELIESLGWWERPARPLHMSRTVENVMLIGGAALLAIPLLLPREFASYTFGMVWLGFILLLDPVNFRLGLPSLIGDLALGRRGRLYALLGSGWTCGWLWEFWNYWAIAKWHYVFPMFQGMKIFEMPAPGFLGFPPFAVECFAMYVSASALLRWDQKRGGSQGAGKGRQVAPVAIAFIAGVLFCPATVHAGGLNLPPEAERGLHLLYSGQPDAALADFSQIEAEQPESPLGYLLEAEARWWQIYCESCEIRWNMVDAWRRPKLPGDDAYFALLDKAQQLAEASIARGDSAEMRFYAGMAYALRARLTGLRIERRSTASAGVHAREQFLRALQLDPDLTDAYTGIGLYNYYVDSMSAVAKVLRFFMGIPGGDKRDGIEQLMLAAERGTVTRVGARFYLARSLRNLDLDYPRSIEVIKPLIAEYPQNPIFQLFYGDTEAKLNHKELAAAAFRAAAAAGSSDVACDARVQQVAAQSLAALSIAKSSH